MRFNDDLREFAKEKGVRQWRIADELGIAESTFVKWMRKPLPEDVKKKAFEAVDRLSKED